MPKHRKGKKSNVWNQYWLEFGSFGKREFKKKGQTEDVVLKDFIKYLGQAHGRSKIMRWLMSKNDD
jgi:hypothetical protein